jgi:hypothetical protein
MVTSLLNQSMQAHRKDTVTLGFEGDNRHFYGAKIR